jgi:hypothetical protein
MRVKKWQKNKKNLELCEDRRDGTETILQKLKREVQYVPPKNQSFRKTCVMTARKFSI